MDAGWLLGKATAPEAPAEAPAGRAPSEVPVLPRTGAPSAVMNAPAGRGKRGRRTAKAPVPEAPAGGAPSEVPALPRTSDPSAAVGAPTGRGKRRRWAAGKRAASGTPKGLSRVTFTWDTVLQYKAAAKKPGGSAARLDAYRSASSMGEFFDLHPGSTATARNDLGWGSQGGALQHTRVRRSKWPRVRSPGSCRSGARGHDRSLHRRPLDASPCSGARGRGRRLTRRRNEEHFPRAVRAVRADRCGRPPGTTGGLSGLAHLRHAWWERGRAPVIKRRPHPRGLPCAPSSAPGKASLIGQYVRHPAHDARGRRLRAASTARASTTRPRPPGARVSPAHSGCRTRCLFRLRHLAHGSPSPCPAHLPAAHR